MDYYQSIRDDLFVKISWSAFQPKQGVSEFYIIAEILQPKLSGEEQLNCIEQAIAGLCMKEEFKNVVPVWKRYYVSDAVNQHSWFQTSFNAAVSVIQQPPLNQSKLVLWIYAVENISLFQEPDGTVVMKRPHYMHLYNEQLIVKTGNSYEQTKAIFKQYMQILAKHHCTLKEHCLRTWLFVQNIDRQYKGMALARKELFAATDLTPQTHFITSTGIEGQSIYPEVLVMMDAYTVRGIKRNQIRYLHASTHLNPTHEYGVTFERGTCIRYGDREHIFISGTASIDHHGEIVYPMQIEKQTERTMENIDALLTEAKAGWSDVTHLIVYLRDIADYENTRKYFETNYPGIPSTILLAPVCRPGWLIEVECSAIKEITDSRFNEF